MDPNWPYLRGYKAFKRVGSDVFLTVSPGKNHLFVADAEVTFQITSQRNRFKKPIEIYKNVDLYGKNVVSTEGAIWRQHRKLTSPSFSETNNELVWNETLYQTQAMLEGWNRHAGLASEVAKDTMTMTLNVISRAGFGVSAFTLLPFLQAR